MISLSGIHQDPAAKSSFHHVSHFHRVLCCRGERLILETKLVWVFSYEVFGLCPALTLPAGVLLSSPCSSEALSLPAATDGIKLMIFASVSWPCTSTLPPLRVPSELRIRKLNFIESCLQKKGISMPGKEALRCRDAWSCLSTSSSSPTSAWMRLRSPVQNGEGRRGACTASL